MKLIFRTILACFMLFWGISINAQSTAPSSVGKEVITQKATTEKGKEVVLRSDGTWEYSEGKALNTKTNSDGKSNTLSLETGVIFKSGDIKPIARTKFYLLDDSMTNILRAKGLVAPKSMFGKAGDSDKHLLEGYLHAIRYTTFKGFKEFYSAANEALLPHIVQTVTTDFSGKAVFEAVPPGNYFLMGTTKISDNDLIWNTGVEIKDGKNSIVLDQNNASIIL